MGESQLLTTRQVADFLGLTLAQFKRLRHENKSRNGDLARGLTPIEISKAQQENKYKLSDVKKLKKDLDLVFDGSKVVISSEAAKMIGIARNTFIGYRTSSDEVSPLGEAIKKLKEANYLKQGNFFFKSDIEEIMNKDFARKLTCKNESCDKSFLARGSNHFYCSAACKMDANPIKISKPLKRQKGDGGKAVLSTYASYSEIPKPGERCHAGRIALSPFAPECLNCKLNKCEVL